MTVPRLFTACLLAALLGLLLASVAPDLAWGDSTGGAGPGSGAPTTTPTDSGGATVGADTNEPRPVAPVFHLTPRTMTVGEPRPRLVLRVEQPTSTTVKAAVKVTPPNGRAVTLKLGAIRTGTAVVVRLPTSLKLTAGTYTFALSVTDRTGQHLKTSKTGTGRATLTVTAKETAPAATDPTKIIVPDPNAAPTTPTSAGGDRFPVQGPHTFGGADARFGAGRTGHIHQGQDVVADPGLPVVAPTSGEITDTGYQAAAAGEWIAMHSSDGRDFFFAHCIRHSTVVSTGTAVQPGTRLCSVGETGDATGPHLHFEIWVNGWRTSSASTPIDPLPQLKAWQAEDPRW